MNSPQPQTGIPNNHWGTDSLDSPIFLSDEPGDTTVRPASPETLKRFSAERERLAKLGFNLDGTPIKRAPIADAK